MEWQSPSGFRVTPTVDVLSNAANVLFFLIVKGGQYLQVEDVAQFEDREENDNDKGHNQETQEDVLPACT